MNQKNKYRITIFLLLILNICQAQNIIDDIETYLFSEIFSSNKTISEFIELNDQNDTMRYWIFDQKGNLSKEVDFRDNSWSASVGGQITHKSTTTKTENVYSYRADRQVHNYVETKDLDSNTLITNHEFKYPSRDSIIETFKIDNGDKIKMDFEITKINKNSKPKTIVQIMKNYVGTSYVQSTKRIEFVYNQQNSLLSQYQYFSVNSFFENQKPEIENERLGSKINYTYDKKGRLKNIYEVEYTEEGITKLRKDAIFKYKGKTERIRNIEINYGENYFPNFVKYEITYKKNGDISDIKINEVCFSYIIKK